MKQNKNYWEDTPDTEIDTGKNVLRYFKEYERLQISNPDWTDRTTGEVKRGKTLSINLSVLKNNPDAVELFKKIIEDIAI